MTDRSPRLAVRAVIVEQDRLFLVNAYPGNQSDLWCCPGGGVERHASIPDNLIREVFEETGMRIAVGRLLAVSEFHAPAKDYHQVDLFYRCTIADGFPDENWRDAEGVVNRWRWVTQQEYVGLRVKPDTVAEMAFGPDGPVIYDPLEPIVD
ncbi:NUDIX domain-containing protein [Monaibacterium marinum]|nr:NUDIX domain-containing protein [Monaibacterium marinum]